MASQFGHIRKKKEFDNLFKNGRASYDQLLGIKVLKTASGVSRYGVIISNKVSKKAVDRNKLRRQVRYLFAKHGEELMIGFDAIVLVLPAALGQPFASLEKSWLYHLRRLRLSR